MKAEMKGTVEILMSIDEAKQLHEAIGARSVNDWMKAGCSRPIAMLISDGIWDALDELFKTKD